MARVVIVDDSLITREILREILSDAPDIEVVGSAADPIAAVDVIERLKPDVVTLDIEMPRMGGLEFIETVMPRLPIAVLVISSHVQPGGALTIQALEMGAVDCVAKPGGSDRHSLLSLGDEIITKIRAAAAINMTAARQKNLQRASQIFRSQTATPALQRIVGVGASTGGVQAIRDLMVAMPADAPPILIAQHMPEGFTRSFADRLNKISDMRVSEAEDGMPIERGHVYIAPGRYHLELSGSLSRPKCRVTLGTAEDQFSPSVNVLFESIASVAGSAGVGVVLTGMGRDGAIGLKLIRDAGGSTACQDEKTSLIYGMPKAALESGAAQKQISLSRIPNFILENHNSQSSSRVIARTA